MTQKPKNLDDYKKWYNDMFKEELYSYESIYNTTQSYVLDNLNKSDLISGLNIYINELQDKYFIETKSENLYLRTSELKIVSKPFDSVVSKTYRKNILNNKIFPDPPQSGWINHNSWFENINDIFRGIIFVKYLDGVKFIVNGLENYCNEKNIKFSKFYEARDEGYYGAHFYIETSINIINKSWQVQQKMVKIEIQITTELKGLIKKLLHSYYEENRDLKKDKNSLPWQWEYDNSEFDSNYLGHLVHNIEASILKVRNKIKEEKL